MALINCPECNREVSDSAKVCPHCGFPVRKYFAEKKAEEEERAKKLKELESIKCAECGRPIGNVDVCPYCGFDMKEYNEHQMEEMPENIATDANVLEKTSDAETVSIIEEKTDTDGPVEADRYNYSEAQQVQDRVTNNNVVLPKQDNRPVDNATYQAQTNNSNSSNTSSSVDNGSGAGWGVLGFFIPLVGLILFLVWNTSRPKAAKAAGIGALIGGILSVLFVAVVMGSAGAAAY